MLCRAPHGLRGECGAGVRKPRGGKCVVAWRFRRWKIAGEIRIGILVAAGRGPASGWPTAGGSRCWSGSQPPRGPAWLPSDRRWPARRRSRPGAHLLGVLLLRHLRLRLVLFLHQKDGSRISHSQECMQIFFHLVSSPVSCAMLRCRRCLRVFDVGRGGLMGTIKET